MRSRERASSSLERRYLSFSERRGEWIRVKGGGAVVERGNECDWLGPPGIVGAVDVA